MDPNERAALKAEIRAEIMLEVGGMIASAIAASQRPPDPTVATPVIFPLSVPVGAASGYPPPIIGSLYTTAGGKY
jgi:hypothetical protein